MEKNFYGLWYKEPAHVWDDALPIGNGRLGASIYGGIENEIIVVNEETVWDGMKQLDRTNPNAYEKLQEIRRAIFNQENEKTTELCDQMLGVPYMIDSYQPLMRLHVSISNPRKHNSYVRALDINEAIHYTMFNQEWMEMLYTVTREAFASGPDQLLMMKWTTTDPTGCHLNIHLDRFSDVQVDTDGCSMTLQGKCREGGVGFAAVVKILIDKGTITQNHGMLRVDNAPSVEFRIAGRTDFVPGDPVEKCHADLAKAAGKSYEEIRAAHVKDYQSYYGRQSFTLRGNVTEKSTLEMLREYRGGKVNNGLAELNYNYLRYLLISASRPGCKPSTLQGIWAAAMQGPWNSDYHPNVNMQINYWPAEGFNLAECVEPLFDWMKSIIPSGKRTAQVHYHARGWVLHHVSDIFGCTTPIDGPWGIWPVGGAWLCRHLYEHYLYNGDKEFLRRDALPMMDGAVRFMLDFLVECPAGLPGEGHLVTCPSHSPENRFYDHKGNPCYVTYAATMDMEIIWDLFDIYLKTLAELGEESEIAEEVRQAQKRLVPIRISQKTGGIAEWIDDYDETQIGHRHVSHLYALFPGTQICQDEKLMQASAKTLERRLTHDYHGTSWGYGWLAVLFARLKNKEWVGKILDILASTYLLDNMFVNSHWSPQVGDGFAYAAAVQEALVQSHMDLIDIFPALPPQWPEGRLAGFRVRGGHELDVEWKNGREEELCLRAARDQQVKIRTVLCEAYDAKGQCIATRDENSGMLVFDVHADEKYVMK